MLRRCFDPEDVSYKHYGGRGITICERWLTFENYALDVGLPPHENATVDRIDNNGDYEPGNIRWTDRTQQCKNRRTFKNNTTGERGVVKVGDRFTARVDEYGTSYTLGRFDTPEEAAAARQRFLEMLPVDREAALAMTDRRARYDSVTGIKGLSLRKDGYYVVRTTINGTRVYHGATKNYDEALQLLEKVNRDEQH